MKRKKSRQFLKKKKKDSNFHDGETQANHRRSFLRKENIYLPDLGQELSYLKMFEEPFSFSEEQIERLNDAKFGFENRMLKFAVTYILYEQRTLIHDIYIRTYIFTYFQLSELFRTEGLRCTEPHFHCCQKVLKKDDDFSRGCFQFQKSKVWSKVSKK